jgi:predicted dehydrogenase/threonine dehydrogenase-like Zn-dependent dehydrogenase
VHTKGRRIKDFFNEQATLRLAQLGHSDPMIRDAKREAWWWLQARAQALRKRTPLLAGSAVVWTAPGRAELVRVEVPSARAGEVTLKMVTSVVSPGTERAQYLRLPNAGVSFPHRPGYSGAGVVIAVGAGVSRLKPGDLVAARNVPHMSVVTAPASSMYRVPSGVPHEAAALVQLGVISGQGISRAGIEPGEPICVVGAGLVGALAQRLAAAAGAGPSTVIARSRVKEALARAGGAARFLVAEADADEIATLESPVVVEATGDPEAVVIAAEAAGRGGRVVLLGSPRGVTTDMPLSVMRAKRLRLIGAHIDTLRHQSRLTDVDPFDRAARAFLELLSAGRLLVSDLIEVVIDPREADSFYRRLARARDVVGARFDWTLLPAEERVDEARLLSLPDLSGRGMDFHQRPLAPGGRRSGRVSLLGQGDPFEGASGGLRIGLFGCGDIAEFDAAAIRETPNVELVACYDPIHDLAQDLARRYGVEAAETSAALLERDDIDAVLLSVPHHLHAPLGAEVAAAGKHVIVEKPLANNLAAAVELVQATDRAGVILSVCFPQRYQPSVVIARRLIAAGAIGELAGVSLNFFMDKPSSYWVGGFSGRTQSTWRSSSAQAGGGVLIMNLSHYIDLIRYLTGVEVEVVSARTHAVERTAEVEDAVSVTARCANGALASLLACAALRGAEISTEFRLWGSDGQIAVEPDPRVYTVRALDGLRTSRWQTFGRLPATDSRAIYFSRLATAIDCGQSPDVTGRDGLVVQAFIEAAYRSRESGQSVSPAALLDETRMKCGRGVDPTAR